MWRERVKQLERYDKDMGEVEGVEYEAVVEGGGLEVWPWVLASPRTQIVRRTELSIVTLGEAAMKLFHVLLTYQLPSPSFHHSPVKLFFYPP